MKLLAALAFLTAASANPFAPKTSNNANAKYVGKLMRGAKELRRLNEDYEPNIAQYSVKFEQCQFVKHYDDELAEDEDTGTVLQTSRFVIFRLCPNGSCSSCDYNYGEYLVDLATYLESTVEYFEEQQEEMCQACEEMCQNGGYNGYQNQNQDQEQEEENNDEEEDGEDRRLREINRQLQQNYYNVDCSTCYDDCQKMENMEENGYYEATEFMECQMIYDPEDDGRAGLYAGPICASGGSKIKIGVFTDEECLFLDSSKDVDDYLMSDEGYQMKLSHALLKQTYTDTCISCREVDEDAQQGYYNGGYQNGQNNGYQNGQNNGYQNGQNNGYQNNGEEPEVIDLCENLYEEAAKCEKTHGFDNGYSNYYGYENQLKNEEVVCDYIQSLKSGTYDEEGEIVVTGASTTGSGGTNTTGGQKAALTFFILGTVGLAVYAAMLHSKLTKGGKTDLSSAGGAMA